MAASINVISINELLLTSNSTQQTVNFYSANENSSGQVNVTVIARRVSDGATKGWQFSAAFKRNTGNATVSVTLLGNLGTGTDLGDLLFATATLDTSGADVRIRVSGLSSTDIEWYATMLGNELQLS